MLSSAPDRLSLFLAVVAMSMTGCGAPEEDVRVALGVIDLAAFGGAPVRVEVELVDEGMFSVVGSDPNGRFASPVPVGARFAWRAVEGETAVPFFTAGALVCSSGPPFDTGAWRRRGCGPDPERCVLARRRLEACTLEQQSRCETARLRREACRLDAELSGCLGETRALRACRTDPEAGCAPEISRYLGCVERACAPAVALETESCADACPRERERASRECSPLEGCTGEVLFREPSPGACLEASP